MMMNPIESMTMAHHALGLETPLTTGMYGSYMSGGHHHRGRRSMRGGMRNQMGSGYHNHRNSMRGGYNRNQMVGQYGGNPMLGGYHGNQMVG